MTDEQMQSLFRTVANHLESLAIRLQKAQELRKQDRIRQEADRPRQEAVHARLDRLERMLKLRVRRGNREWKESRERLNALLDAKRRNAARLSGRVRNR